MPQTIDALYVWVATEPDGGEGVVAAEIGDMMMPLVGADNRPGQIVAPLCRNDPSEDRLRSPSRAVFRPRGSGGTAMTRQRSGRGRGRPAIVWTADMLSKLRELRDRGVALQVCAEAIGVDYGTLRKRAQIEGLARPLNRGTISGEKVMRKVS